MFALVVFASGSATAAEPTTVRDDALSLELLLNQKYAYLEGLPGGRFVLTPKLREEAEAVDSPRALVRFAERALTLLADHHAITAASLKESWAVFPSYGDLWVDRRAGRYVIEAVRDGTPAHDAGIRAGDRLMGVNGVPIGRAVHAFWSDLGATGGGHRDSYAARVLAAGRRDRPRHLTVIGQTGIARDLVLPSLYHSQLGARLPLSAQQHGLDLVIEMHDSLGDRGTIVAFDHAMAGAAAGQRIVIDLTDTPSGGNTTVARAILGWFVSRPFAYQVHTLPAEQRETGIARQWIEQVSPRAGRHHTGPVTVRVGRWTGSMGEGLAIGFDAIGAPVEGTRMAGLLGAIYDYRLPASGVVVKLPTERLSAVDGTPRENFIPVVVPDAASDPNHIQ